VRLVLISIIKIFCYILGGVLMKRFLIIGLIVALALIVIGGAGVVYAQVSGNVENQSSIDTNTQNGDQFVQPFGYGPGGMMGEYGNQSGLGQGGMMGRNEQGYGPGGMMGRNENGYGPGGIMGEYGRGGMMNGSGMGQYAGVMHEYMISAFASAVGLTVDGVNTRITNGETPKQIAIAQGKTEADLPALWLQIRQDALNKAVSDGVITQAQADVMLQHMNNYAGPGFGAGFGDCPMWDGDEAQP
jgi:hypothetical protein